MPIEFRCPQCDKLLRVPDESAGAKAKCPQCQSIAEVPSAAGDSTPAPAETSPFGQDPQGAASSTEEVNPYSSPAAAYDPPKPSMGGEIVPTQVETGEVIRYAWDVWKANLGLLVGVTLVVAIQDSVFRGGQNYFAEQGSPEIAGPIAFCNFLIQTFLGIGQAHIVLKLLRHQPAQFGDLFGGGSLYLRTLGASIIAAIAIVAGMFLCVVPGILLLLFFWPFYYLIVDEKAKALESFGMAKPIAEINVGTSFVLWLASFGIILVGCMAFIIGLLFAAPLVSLMWGTAYLMMTGQLSTKPTA